VLVGLSSRGVRVGAPGIFLKFAARKVLQVQNTIWSRQNFKFLIGSEPLHEVRGGGGFFEIYRSKDAPKCYLESSELQFLTGSKHLSEFGHSPEIFASNLSLERCSKILSGVVRTSNF
jgi:hypothetical protein